MFCVFSEGKDVIPRRDGVWSTESVAIRILECLRKAECEVPFYLENAVAELADNNHRLAAFSMPCYWEGEAHLGIIDGVMSSRSGWLEGEEVIYSGR